MADPTARMTDRGGHAPPDKMSHCAVVPTDQHTPGRLRGYCARADVPKTARGPLRRPVFGLERWWGCLRPSPGRA